MKKIGHFALGFISVIGIAFIAIGCGGTGSGRNTPRLDSGTNDSPDLAMMQSTSKPDLAMQQNTQLACGDAIDCINNCTDQSCFMDCKNMSTTQGWNLLQALFACIFGDGANVAGACPDSNGGICDQMAANYNSSACDNCVSKAQMTGGACYQALMDCANDTP